MRLVKIWVWVVSENCCSIIRYAGRPYVVFASVSVNRKRRRQRRRQRRR